jgi:hypothetical protein
VIGGPPVAQPIYPYQYPQYPVQPQAYVQQPPRPQPSRQPAPVVRGQMPDETLRRPAPPKLEMPSPETLDVPMPVAPPDWTDLRVRLDRAGATRFSLEKQADGYRFTCDVPAGNGQVRTVEGRAASEGEAVQRALSSVGK